MRKVILPLVTLVVISLTSCVGKSVEKKAKELQEELTEEIQEAASSSDEETDKKASSDLKNLSCDEFLDKYEKWVNEFLEYAAKAKENPMDTKLLTEYSKKAQEASEWVMNWTSLVKCADDEKYEKRFQEISDNAEKKIEELGL